MRKPKKLKVVAHYMIKDGDKKEFDPTTTNLPDRCKLALAQMISTKEYELVEKADSY